jgi:hypothetical protein
MNERDQAVCLPVSGLMNEEIHALPILIVIGKHQVPVVPGILSRRQHFPESAAFLGVGFGSAGPCVMELAQFGNIVLHAEYSKQRNAKGDIGNLAADSAGATASPMNYKALLAGFL